jgi:hypothetical protein
MEDIHYEVVYANHYEIIVLSEVLISHFNSLFEKAFLPFDVCEQCLSDRLEVWLVEEYSFEKCSTFIFLINSDELFLFE